MPLQMMQSDTSNSCSRAWSGLGSWMNVLEWRPRQHIDSKPVYAFCAHERCALGPQSSFSPVLDCISRRSFVPRAEWLRGALARVDVPS
jgi:hypothetical protein